MYRILATVASNDDPQKWRFVADYSTYQDAVDQAEAIINTPTTEYDEVVVVDTTIEDGDNVVYRIH